MPYALKPGKTSQNPPSFVDLTTPTRDILKYITPLLPRGNRDSKLTFEEPTERAHPYGLIVPNAKIQPDITEGSY